MGFRLDGCPVAPGATVEEALGGGDDYELVFTAPDGDRVTPAFAAAGLTPPIAIGVCTPTIAAERELGVARRTALDGLGAPSGLSSARQEGRRGGRAARAAW